MNEGIEIRTLHHIYNPGTKGAVHALSGIDLDIGRNETVAIVGENGSGKTTLAKHLNGLLTASEGYVKVNGKTVMDTPVDQMASIVGFAFQNPNDQLFNSSVRKEIRFGPHNIGMPVERLREMEEYAALVTGLADRLDEHPYDLSYSERKLLSIASVISMDPDFIVLDEPTTGQDYKGVVRIGKIIRSLHERGKTIITITHDMDFAADYFRRTIVLCRGKKLLDGETEAVLSKTDELQKSRIKPPHLTLLAQTLCFDRPVYTIEGFYESIVKRMEPEA